jgi:hypothetical protein
MRWSHLFICLCGFALAGCATSGPATSPNGDARSGDAKNVFNINLNVDTPYGRVGGSPQQASDGGGYQQQASYRTVPLANQNPFPIRVYWNNQFVDLPPNYYQYIYLPHGPQTLVVVWPDGRQFPQQL